MMIEIEHRPSDSPYIERVWSSGAAPTRMHSIANSNWEFLVWAALDGRVHASIRGPETAPSAVEVSGFTNAFGIVFAHGAYLPHLPVPRLVDTAIAAPRVTARQFELRGETWELPTFDSAEDFVTRLARAGVLLRDRLVSDVTAGDEASGLGARSVQRRVVTATGLTQGAIRQIERARQAAVLLGEGVPALDVVHRLGFYDQPHLARSLTRFMGRTATELQRPSDTEPVSLLYKTGDRPAR